MPEHNSANKQRSRAPASKIGGKALGRRDIRAIQSSWQAAEEYLTLLKARVIVHGLTLAICTKAAGAFRYNVAFMDGSTGVLPIAGSIRVKNAHKNIQPCMRPADIILVNGGMITAVLSEDQRNRAEALLGTIRTVGSVAEASVPSEFASRIDPTPSIIFSESFFRQVFMQGTLATEQDWEFDRSEEVEGEGEGEGEEEEILFDCL